MNLRRSPWRETESVTNATQSPDFSHRRALFQKRSGQLLSTTGRRGAPSPSRIDGRLWILNTCNMTRLDLPLSQNNDNLPDLQ